MQITKPATRRQSGRTRSIRRPRDPKKEIREAPMTLTRALGLAAAVLVISTPGRAEIYRWTDAQGRIHFTERIDQVPPEHRNAARASALESRAAERVSTYSSSPSGAPASPALDRAARRAIEIPFTRVGSLMR